MSDEAFDYETIDPGIRQLVRLIRSLGYEVWESGDGTPTSKSPFGEAASAMNALVQPHVFVLVDPDQMVAVANEIFTILKSRGVVFHPSGNPGPYVETSYNPYDGNALVLVANIDDKMLKLADMAS